MLTSTAIKLEDLDGQVYTYGEWTGLSTDVKPTDHIMNGSTIYEMDTGQVYMFDAANNIWRKQ